MNYKIVINPVDDQYYEGVITLDGREVEKTEWCYLDPKKARAEATQVLKRIRKEIDEP